MATENNNQFNLYGFPYNSLYDYNVLLGLNRGIKKKSNLPVIDQTPDDDIYYEPQQTTITNEGVYNQYINRTAIKQEELDNLLSAGKSMIDASLAKTIANRKDVYKPTENDLDLKDAFLNPSFKDPITGEIRTPISTESSRTQSTSMLANPDLSAPKNTAGAMLSGATALLGIGAAIGDVIETRNRQKAIDKMSAYQVAKPPKVEVSPVKSRTEEIRSSHEANVDKSVKTGMYAASRAGATEHMPGLIAKGADASTQIAGILAGHQTQVDAANAQAKQRADEFNAQMAMQQGSSNAQMANQMLGMQQQLALTNRTNAPKYLMQALQEGYGHLKEQDAKKKGYIQDLIWAYENMPYSANKGVLYENLLKEMGINFK